MKQDAVLTFPARESMLLVAISESPARFSNLSARKPASRVICDSPFRYTDPPIHGVPRYTPTQSGVSWSRRGVCRLYSFAEDVAF